MAKKYITGSDGQLYRDAKTGLLLVVDVPEGGDNNPIIATSETEMAELMIEENLGKFIRYEGESGLYVNGECYKVMLEEETDNTQYYTYKSKLALLLGTQDATNNPYEITADDLGNITEISSYSFRGKKGLIGIDLSNITKVGSQAFDACENLTSINAPNIKTLENYAFQYCYKIKSIYMPKVETIGGYGFTQTAITEIDLPEATSIGSDTFLGCRSLIRANLPKVTGIGYRLFSSCSKLKEVNAPNIKSVGGNAFDECSSLEEIDLSQVTTIGSYAFRKCSSLKSVNIPLVAKLERDAFSDCTSLTEVNAPYLQNIGHYAFLRCRSLTTLRFTAYLYSAAGSSCLCCGTTENKCTFIFEGTTPPTIGTTTFDVNTIEKIIVPKGYGETYKTATNWATFADYIVEAEE